MVPPTIISEDPFPSRAIFWPSGHTMPIRGTYLVPGLPYLYQLEANGSATYLTKGDRSRWSRWRLFRKFRFPVGQYSGRRGIRSRSGWGVRCRCCLSLSIGSQWIGHLPDQSDRFDGAAGDKFRNLGFPIGQYSCRRGIHSRFGGNKEMPGRCILLIWLDFLNFRKKLPLPMEPPAINLATPFHSQATFLQSGHTLQIRGHIQCWGCKVCPGPKNVAADWSSQIYRAGFHQAIFFLKFRKSTRSKYRLPRRRHIAAASWIACGTGGSGHRCWAR